MANAAVRASATSKLDLRRELKYLLAPPAARVEIVDVPKFNFVMLDGRIEPGQTVGDSPFFQEAVAALYGISYTLKFMSKRRHANPVDYPVMPLEGLWWTDSGVFDQDPSQPMNWTLMMMQPRHITSQVYAEALAQLQRKKDSTALRQIRFESFHEGICIQTMHIGPYSAESTSLERMEAFAEENGFRYRGRHHEIYLGDPRRAAPEKLRTILRHPVVKLASRQPVPVAA